MEETGFLTAETNSSDVEAENVKNRIIVSSQLETRNTVDSIKVLL